MEKDTKRGPGGSEAEEEEEVNRKFSFHHNNEDDDEIDGNESEVDKGELHGWEARKIARAARYD